MTRQLQLRKGVNDDQDWLFDLFRCTMQNHIDKAWGWDELLQREGFVTSLPVRNFQVLLSDDIRVGSFHLTDKPDHLLLDMILVIPERQHEGFGRFLMERVKEKSRAKSKPVHLSVLKTNPAMQFHLASGFKLVEEDSHSVRMAWSE
ncbi:MAG: N-acetyltransferase [Gammaproteobacteria bacterium]|nr:N-acetyltransferase [Gammaproteobacteria bacterium]